MKLPKPPKPKKARDKRKQLRARADKLWKQIILRLHPICEGCGEEYSITGHHFFPKGQFGHLRYVIDNGIGIGIKCHFNHHHKDDPDIHFNIIGKRGKKWYKDLRDISRENPASYQTIAYYKKVINELNKYET